MNSKSLLFRKEEAGVINRICLRHFSQCADKIKLLKGGLFNTTYSVRLKDGIKYVLRFSPINSQLVLPFEMHLTEAEIVVSELLTKNSVSTNVVITQSFERDITDRDYVIFQYIDGIPLSSNKIRKKQKLGLYQQTGELAKKIHTIKGDYFGRVSDSFRGKHFITWDSFLFSELFELTEECDKYSLLPKPLLKEIKQLFEKGSSCFENITEPYLVHGDLWSGNVMVDKKGMTVLAVIDTDRCIFGDPDFDLAMPWMITKDFLQGYGEIKKSQNRRLKLLYYSLLQAIVDCYACKVEYRNTRNYKKCVKTVYYTVNKIRGALC